jgi:hypothetical protein
METCIGLLSLEGDDNAIHLIVSLATETRNERSRVKRCAKGAKNCKTQ